MKPMPRERVYGLVCWAVLTAATLFYGFHALWDPAPIEPLYEGDEGVFSRIGERPLWSTGFWASIRPWTVPLVHKAMGLNDSRVVVFQIVLSIVSHAFLAGVVFWLLGRRVVGLIGAAGVYAYALLPMVTGFALVIRSESVAFSLTAVTLGWLMLYVHVQRHTDLPWWRELLTAFGLWLSATLLVFARDNWSVLLPIVAAYVGIGLLTRRKTGTPRREVAWVRAGLIGCLIVSYLLSVITVRVGERWRFPLHNVIFQRVLTDPEATKRWAVDYGMPLDENVLRMRGRSPDEYDWAIYRHEEFQNWMTERGVASYLDWIGRDVPSALDGIWMTLHREVDVPCVQYYKGRSVGSWTGALSSALLFQPLGGWVELGIVLCLTVPLAIGLAFRGGPGAPAMGVFLMASSLPFQAAFVHLGDAMEMSRHLLPVSLSLRLLLAMLLVLVMGAAVYTGERLRQEMRAERARG